jgi:hypothetical protein
LISNPTTVKNKKVSKDRNLNGTNKKVWVNGHFLKTTL